MSDSADMGQAKDPLRTALALFAKELIWRYFVRFSPSQPSDLPLCVAP